MLWFAPSEVVLLELELSFVFVFDFVSLWGVGRTPSEGFSFMLLSILPQSCWNLGESSSSLVVVFASFGSKFACQRLYWNRLSQLSGILFSGMPVDVKCSSNTM